MKLKILKRYNGNVFQKKISIANFNKKKQFLNSKLNTKSVLPVIYKFHKSKKKYYF